LPDLYPIQPDFRPTLPPASTWTRRAGRNWKRSLKLCRP